MAVCPGRGDALLASEHSPHLRSLCGPVARESVLDAWPLPEVTTENNRSGDWTELVRKPLLWLQNTLIILQTCKCFFFLPSPPGGA